jgi:hypothetical protein
MTKDCSLQRGQVKGGGRGLCLRCGRANCPAADYSDWFRCAQLAKIRPYSAVVLTCINCV